MKKFLSVLGGGALLIFVLVSGQIGGVVGKRAVKSYTDNKQKEELAQILLETSKEINKQLPMMVDNDTQLNFTMATGNTLTYKYTMVNYHNNEIDKNEFQRLMKDHIVKNQCNTKNTRDFLNYGVFYSYLYFDKLGNYMLSVDISKNDCGI